MVDRERVGGKTKCLTSVALEIIRHRPRPLSAMTNSTFIQMYI